MCFICSVDYDKDDVLCQPSKTPASRHSPWLKPIAPIKPMEIEGVVHVLMEFLRSKELGIQEEALKSLLCVNWTSLFESRSRGREQVAFSLKPSLSLSPPSF
ncbi:hypothetical protein L1987_49824 [Smallanthus sonchifolius]|uniref:Uncharacterized protein n=1 Tax=Smallanthus sonchifolius TaxID=185202 RepID=A0ACB9FVC2_9ASTR|nr:hypothetical protein L1987_49824 [Smallanthus sonchifolius]